MPGRWDGYRLDGCLIPKGMTAEPVMSVRRGNMQPNVDLRNLCSPVDDQRTLGSCSACAVVGSLEFLQRKRNTALNELAILYVFYNARQLAGYPNEKWGVFIHHAVAAIVAHGACEESYWPYDVSKVFKEPPVAAYTNGSTHQAIQFARVAGDEGALMQLLSEGQPVIFASFFEGPEMNEAAKSGHMPIHQQRPPGRGGHSMLIVGYDQRRREWLVRNSWGADFGEKGYLWIPFESLKAFTDSNLYWTIGDLDAQPTRSISGPSQAQMAASVKSDGPSEAASALTELRASLGKEMQDHLDDSKKSIRDRLRATEDKLAQKRNPDGGGNNEN